MPAPYHYYVYPFGENADDRVAIPDAADPGDHVSYFAGWTDPYEFDLDTNPLALPIPRGQMNQLFYDITNNLQQYQQYGTPPWVVGNTVEYPIHSRVYYNDAIYESIVADNIVTPGADDTWVLISGFAQGVPIGAFIDHGSPVAPSGYLACAGATVSRVTYALLLAAITNTQSGTTTNTTVNVTGLTDTSTFYVGMAVEGAGIQAGTTVASIPTGTTITLSLPATASATVPLKFFYWGNGNGTTTFTLPDSRRKVMMGAGGGSSAVIGDKVGQSGGEAAHTIAVTEMPAHAHPGSYWHLNAGDFSGGSPAQVPLYSGGGTDIGNTVVTVASQGGGQAANIIQQSMISFRMIKYI